MTTPQGRPADPPHPPESDTSHLSPSGLTQAEIAEQLARADGTLGAAGHKVTNPASREIMRQQAAGEITGDQARAQLIANARAIGNTQRLTNTRRSAGRA